MSLERRVAQMRHENCGEIPVYSLIAKVLQEDRKALFTYFKQNGRSSTQALDEELIDVYKLKPAELPTLILSNNLSFVAGFSYVASHWYPLIEAVASGVIAPDEERFMDSHLERMFPDRVVTTRHTFEMRSQSTQAGQRGLNKWQKSNLEKEI